MRFTIAKNSCASNGPHRLNVALLVLALAAVVGCSKKETPPPQADTSASTAPAQVSTPPTHQPAPAPPPPPAAPAQDIDTVVNDRSIAYLRGLVARKDYTRARQSLKMFEGRTLTPAQQQALDQLKAQIPPG